MASERLDSGTPDGAKIGGASTDKIGFYAATATTRPSVTWPNTGTATTALNETKVNRLMAALVKLGLIATT